MNHFTLRFAVAVLAPLAILQPNIGHCAPAAAAAAAAEVRMDHISVTETGKGSPVILIPGLSSPRAVWDGVAPELAKSHRVILVQVNGFAGDDAGANLKPGVLDGIVGDLHGYIAQHKLQGAAVVGHSMGGLVGLMLAKAQPGDVGKLMIVDSLPWYGMLFGPGATVDAVKPQAAAMRDRFAASYGKARRGGQPGNGRAVRAPPGRPGQGRRLDGQDRHARVGGSDVRGHDHRPARRHGQDRDADHDALPDLDSPAQGGGRAALYGRL